MGYESIKKRLTLGDGRTDTLFDFRNAFIAGASSGMVSQIFLSRLNLLCSVLCVYVRVRVCVYDAERFLTFTGARTKKKFAAVVTTPFDVIKTQRQVTSGTGKFWKAAGCNTVWGFRHSSRLLSLALRSLDGRLGHLMRVILNEQGMRGFFSGRSLPGREPAFSCVL